MIGTLDKSMSQEAALISDQLSPNAEQQYHDLLMRGSTPLSHADFESPEHFHMLRTALRDEKSLMELDSSLIDD
jgi:hypothetical protein